MKRKSAIALVSGITLACSMVLAGCGNSANTSSSGNTQKSADKSSSEAKGTDNAKKDKEIVIGYSVSTLNNAFFVGLSEGAKEGAQKYGAKLIDVNANGDAGTQLNQVMDLITKKPDAIILNPINADGIVPAVKKANEAGIPVFTLDRGSNGGEVTSFLETNNVDMGTEAAKYIAEQLKKRYGDYKGNVVDLMGLTGTTPAQDREKGFSQEISKYPNIKIVAKQATDFDQEKSLNAMVNILQANDKIDAVFGANDDNTVGASRAIDQAKRYYPVDDPKHIIIIGVDGTAQALDLIRKGKQDATISQNPMKMAEKAFEFAVDMVKNGKKPPEVHYYYPHMLITKDNIDSKEVKDYGLWSEAVKGK